MKTIGAKGGRVGRGGESIAPVTPFFSTASLYQEEG